MCFYRTGRLDYIWSPYLFENLIGGINIDRRPETEFEMRLNEIIYDLHTMKRTNSNAQDIFDKIAEVHHELFDVTVRILCDNDSSLVYKRLVIKSMADPIVRGINERLAHPEIFYAADSDDVIDTE